MIAEFYTIKALKKGAWYYYHKSESNDPDRQWESDLYFADRFKTEKEAEDHFKNMCKIYHWGGYFKVDKYFVSR